MIPVLSSKELLNIAEEFGSPLYIYNADRISYQFQKLKNAFKDIDSNIFYACKSLTNIHVLKYMRSLGSSIDCSSINEVKLAMHAGFTASEILYTSNGINFSEIVEAKELGVHINIDSISNLEKFGQKYGHSYPVGIRIRPNILAGGNLKISTGHDKSKFGIPIENVTEILNCIENNNLHVNALHIHTGSEIGDAAVFLEGIKVLFTLLPQFDEVTIIDLGGGFKIAYKPKDNETDVEDLAGTIKNAFDKYEQETGRHFKIWLEPGKFLVSAAGYFVCKVNVLKPTANTIFAGVDTGFNHFIRPMFYNAWHEIENITNPDGILNNYSVVGNICETDTFAWDRPIALIKEGDFLAFHNAGAYGFEMSSNYNSRLKPAEILVTGGRSHLVRRRETFDDLLRHQVV
ncbi:MAG: diaminopimelate decarboxylase [Ginsengibacter sp.]